MNPLRTLWIWLVLGCAVPARDYHVAVDGNDAHTGTSRRPLRTISAAAGLAQPGDTITVHAGTYRERVNPPRGGTSDSRRIVYQAARGERVEIKGSEVVKDWVFERQGVWKATLPNSMFGEFNPYTNLIRGDWFDPRGREHHTGAVYLDGEWLTEATSRGEVFLPPEEAPAWLQQQGDSYLLNVAWLRPAGATNLVRAPDFAAQQGLQTAACSEGGACVGWVNHGDWARYEAVELAAGTDALELRVASASAGGTVEVRLDGPGGELLGRCEVENTGGWQSWVSVQAPIRKLGGTRTLCLVFRDRYAATGASPSLDPRLWFAQVDETHTHIWANFGSADPRERRVEINVRQAVFYPEAPGRDYITVRGFVLQHAATPWAPPTAEQVGLIGTHWSKGWIIEENTVSHSVCSGIALGKHGDAWDNTSADTAEGYVKTIERAYTNGWTAANIGHHIVRNNHISHCEQAGIVGSLGAAFSTVSGNTIHDIHVRRLFTGAEMAGIKFHAAIDTTLRNNHIYRTCRGLWLDWMAQGTRVAANLFHDNAGEDLFVEVDHGPFLVDNNLFLSPVSVLDMSEGGAFAHNLVAGRIISRPEPSRETPFHPPHTTAMAGLTNIHGGDHRFYNNVFVGRGRPTVAADASTDRDPEWAGGFGLWVYDYREYPTYMAGNVYLHGAKAGRNEVRPVAAPAHNPRLRLAENDSTWTLSLDLAGMTQQAATALVTTASLGKARIAGLPYENPEGTPLAVDRDFFGKKRDRRHPVAGPFERKLDRSVSLQVRQGPSR